MSCSRCELPGLRSHICTLLITIADILDGLQLEVYHCFCPDCRLKTLTAHLHNCPTSFSFAHTPGPAQPSPAQLSLSILTKYMQYMSTEYKQQNWYWNFPIIDLFYFCTHKNSWNCVSNLTNSDGTVCGEFTIPPPIEIPSLWCRILKSNILVSVMGKP